MASSKPKTTMNKLNRERKVRERKLDKAARKVARANAPEGTEPKSDDHLAYWLEDPDAPAEAAGEPDGEPPARSSARVAEDRATLAS